VDRGFSAQGLLLVPVLRGASSLFQSVPCDWLMWWLLQLLHGVARFWQHGMGMSPHDKPVVGSFDPVAICEWLEHGHGGLGHS
jgi:hypothetical protein